MNLKKVTRPWQTGGNFKGMKPTKGFYNSKVWRQLREVHLNGTTVLPDGREVQNSLCLHCFIQGKLYAPPAPTIDHIKPISKGGAALDLTNLQTLCDPHNAIKTAKDKH